MPVAQHEQWSQDLSEIDDGAIGRLEAALARIAAAAGRRQDELRTAELNARAAQHEADLLLRAQHERMSEAAADQAAAEATAASLRDGEFQSLASRIDGLIAALRHAIDHSADAGPTSTSQLEEG